MQMSNAEICSRFKQAKDQNEQIEILAELNACGVAEIMEILEEGGCISGLPVKKAQDKQSSIRWTTEMDRELITYCEAGLRAEQIAEKMGLRLLQVKGRKQKLKAAGYILTKKPKPAAKPEGVPSNAAEGAGGCAEVAMPNGLDPLRMLSDSLSCSLRRVSAAVKFEDEAGNAWKLELSREQKGGGKQ